MAASKDNYHNCPFTEDHQRTLSDIAIGMRDAILEEEIKKNPANEHF